MARVPIEAGFFTIPQDPRELPRLLGTRCLRCREVFFPRRVVCARCHAQETEDLELGPRGRLYTWTWVHVPMFGSAQADAKGYGVGQVDLPEGPRVQAVLSGAREELRIGMELELGLEKLRENADGDEVMIFRFRPQDRGAAP